MHKPQNITTLFFWEYVAGYTFDGLFFLTHSKMGEPGVTVQNPYDGFMCCVHF